MLIPYVILNAIDVLMLFLLSHAFIKRIPIFTVKRVLIGVGYGIAMGTIGYFLDSYIYRIVVTVISISLVSFIAKRPFASTLLLYAITWSFGLSQFIFVFIFQFFELGYMQMLFLGQGISLIVIIAACKLLPLSIGYRFIEEHLELKLMIFVSFFICLGVIFYWNYDYSWSYLVFFIGSLIAVAIAIYSIGLKIVYLRHTIPLNTNESYHTNFGLIMKAYKEEDHGEIERLNSLHQDDKFKIQTEGFQLGKASENVVAFIKNKQKLYDRKVEIQHDIDYNSDHPTVNIVMIVKILSILLDNAIESETDKPIIVELTVTASYIQLTVRNEFTPADSEEMSRIFTIDGYTTKKTGQRGYGLTNLHRDVQNANGKIITTHDYNKVGKAQYLNITVTI